MGYVYEQGLDFEQAIFAYSEGSLMSQRRLMRNLIQKFTKCEFPFKNGQNNSLMVKKPADTAGICSAEYLETFLIWANGCGEVVKLQAFQFISELLHRRLSRLSGGHRDSLGIMSRRTLSTTGIISQDLSPSVKSNSRATKAKLGKLGRTTSTNRKGPDVLNELYMCSNPSAEACELTVLLLTRLIDLINLVSRNEFNGEEDYKTSDADGLGLLKTKFRESVRTAILNAESFRWFEMMCCEFQKVDVTGLDDDHKTLFFVNLFNIMTGIRMNNGIYVVRFISCDIHVVHYIVVNGPPSPSIFDRYLFMRSAKYNVGGVILTLMDVSSFSI